MEADDLAAGVALGHDVGRILHVPARRVTDELGNVHAAEVDVGRTTELLPLALELQPTPGYHLIELARLGIRPPLAAGVVPRLPLLPRLLGLTDVGLQELERPLELIAFVRAHVLVDLFADRLVCRRRYRLVSRRWKGASLPRPAAASGQSRQRQKKQGSVHGLYPPNLTIPFSINFCKIDAVLKLSTTITPSIS